MREILYGERFTVVEPTPLLVACIAGAQEVLERALAGAGVTVRAQERLVFGPDVELAPSLLVEAQEPTAPSLVVEFRTETTSRYVLGPKRLVYGRMRVPEMWFADPYRQRVAVLRRGGADGTYTWPPEGFGRADVLRPTQFAGVTVPVAELLGRWPSSHVREPAPGERWPPDV